MSTSRKKRTQRVMLIIDFINIINSNCRLGLPQYPLHISLLQAMNPQQIYVIRNTQIQWQTPYKFQQVNGFEGEEGGGLGVSTDAKVSYFGCGRVKFLFFVK